MPAQPDWPAAPDPPPQVPIPHEAEAPVPVHHTARELAAILRRYPHLERRMRQELMFALHRDAGMSIDALHDEARMLLSRGRQAERGADSKTAVRAHYATYEGQLKAEVDRLLLEYVVRSFSRERVEALINLVRKRERAASIHEVTKLKNVPFRLLRDKLLEYCSIPRGDVRMPVNQIIGVRVDLIKALISDHLRVVDIAKRYLTLRHFGDLVTRIIGNEDTLGRIGGKAAGMNLAHQIVTHVSEAEADADPSTDEKSELATWVHIPDSYYIRADVFDEFLAYNGLDEFRNEKYKSLEQIQQEQPLIQSIFANANFPEHFVTQVAALLESLGEAPLIIRSSSLLEDNFDMAFAGKYASVFIPNQGTLDRRLDEFLSAVAAVYRSVLEPSPLSYRRRRGMLDYDESMGVLVQRVIGKRRGRYFAPTFAGVAFSRNRFLWSKRLKKRDGLLRLVAGLGTRAVDRVSDYPRMVSLSAPSLRPEVTAEEIETYSQHLVDVLDLTTGEIKSLPLGAFLRASEESDALDGVQLAVSEIADGLVRSTSHAQMIEIDRACVTFDRLLRHSPFCTRVHDVLTRLEAVYGCPVDIEFAYQDDTFYLLQCRPLHEGTEQAAVALPQHVSNEAVLFEQGAVVPNQVLADVATVVFVDPIAYAALPDLASRHQVARIVGALNARLGAHHERFILMGPGRWGSRNITLGVPIVYADINYTLALVEIAYERGGVRPEVSYGTHFFQDLVEDGIVPFPIYPGQPGTRFADVRLRAAPNRLVELLPEAAPLAKVVRVVETRSLAPDGVTRLRIVMNGHDDRVIGYFPAPGSSVPGAAPAQPPQSPAS